MPVLSVHESANKGAWLAPTRYLCFERLPFPGRKTTVWAVVSQSSGVKLGELRWYAPWRQYVLWPERGMVFNRECLADIQDRLDTLMRWRKNVRHNLGETT